MAFYLIIFIMFGPPIILFILGRDAKSNSENDRAKKLYIASVVYLIVGLGVCGAFLASI